MRIGLFITCLTDTFAPRVGIAVTRVLEHLGHSVAFPATQTCCGQPMYNNGFRADARDAARRLIDALQGYEAIVTPSGSCAAMIRAHYNHLFDDDERRTAARELADRTYEFVEFLTRVECIDLTVHRAMWNGTATYHPSCHLRELGLIGEAPKLAAQIDGLNLAPLEQADQCCGFGGTFATKYDAVSGEMVRAKIRCVEASSASTLICNDTGCAMNIAGACHRQGSAVRLLSLAEIIAESLGLLEPERRP